MSQRNQRQQTLSQQLGFQDSDLTTPEHDEIMLWLDETLRTEEALWELTGGRKYWNEEWVRRWQDEARAAVARKRGTLTTKLAEAQEQAARWPHLDNIDKLTEELRGYTEWECPEPPAFPTPELLTATWETPVGDQRWTAGFVDLHAEVSLYAGAGLCCYMYRSSNELEEPPRWDVHRKTRVFNFEVKTTIPSLGELIRQVRFYQTKGSSNFVVVSPDDRWIEPLTRQGIAFLTYPSGTFHSP